MRDLLSIYERRNDADRYQLANKSLSEAALQFEVELRMAIIYAQAKYSDARFNPNTADHEVAELRRNEQTLTNLLDRGLFLGLFKA